MLLSYCLAQTRCTYCGLVLVNLLRFTMFPYTVAESMHSHSFFKVSLQLQVHVLPMFLDRSDIHTIVLSTKVAYTPRSHVTPCVSLYVSIFKWILNETLKKILVQLYIVYIHIYYFCKIKISVNN
jgi:hypothetical protein